MKVLLDTNILIDYISKRYPYFDNARLIISMCADEKINGCIAAHSVMNAIYITRKEYTLEERKNIFLWICSVLTVIDIDNRKIINILTDNCFTDIEDCLQTECAKDFSADYIVTRNIKDFESSIIPAILPEDFIKLIK